MFQVGYHARIVNLPEVILNEAKRSTVRESAIIGLQGVLEPPQAYQEKKGLFLKFYSPVDYGTYIEDRLIVSGVKKKKYRQGVHVKAGDVVITRNGNKGLGGHAVSIVPGDFVTLTSVGNSGDDYLVGHGGILRLRKAGDTRNFDTPYELHFDPWVEIPGRSNGSVTARIVNLEQVSKTGSRWEECLVE